MSWSSGRQESSQAKNKVFFALARSWASGSVAALVLLAAAPWEVVGLGGVGGAAGCLAGGQGGPSAWQRPVPQGLLEGLDGA